MLEHRYKQLRQEDGGSASSASSSSSAQQDGGASTSGDGPAKNARNRPFKMQLTPALSSADSREQMSWEMLSATLVRLRVRT